MQSSFYKTFSFDSPKKAFSIMPSRPSRSNKGDFGRVLCICGSRGMAGAAFLSAKAAYRSGAGLVEILTDESNRTVLQSSLPEAIVTVYDSTAESCLLTAIERADAIVAGCGLGVSPSSRKLLSDLLHACDTQSTPLILDADALNLISKNPSLLKHAKGAIITPHMKEFSRLSGLDISEILDRPADLAYTFAKKHSLICVLKDNKTVVTDGSEEIYLNTTGNSGMATGGSGDVLAGILGGILAQRKNSSVPKKDLVCLAVYLHGLCGDIASEKLSPYSLIASDLISALPHAFKLYMQ